MHKEFIELGIDDITIKGSVRDAVGDISTLAASLSKRGMLVPVLVDRNNVAITGARRLAACREAGIRHVPAIRLDTDYDSMAALEIQVDLNLCREPLSSTEVENLIKKKRLIAGRQSPGAAKSAVRHIKRWFGND